MRVLTLLTVTAALVIGSTGCSACKSWFGCSKGDSCAAPAAPAPYYPAPGPYPMGAQMPVVGDPALVGYGR